MSSEWPYVRAALFAIGIGIQLIVGIVIAVLAARL